METGHIVPKVPLFTIPGGAYSNKLNGEGGKKKGAASQLYKNLTKSLGILYILYAQLYFFVLA